MPATDAMIARLESELEERNSFIEGLVANAHDANRDLSGQEMELVGSARERIGALGAQLTPLRETSKITIESRRRVREVDEELQTARHRTGVGPVEYRSAGGYITDYVRAGIGVQDAEQRLEIYNRAAAHQTTGDNPGLLPEKLLAPILASLDYARPLVGAIGPQQLPSGSWSRPRITQHTPRSAKADRREDRASPPRKMIIGKVPINAEAVRRLRERVPPERRPGPSRRSSTS